MLQQSRIMQKTFKKSTIYRQRSSLIAEKKKDSPVVAAKAGFTGFLNWDLAPTFEPHHRLSLPVTSAHGKPVIIQVIQQITKPNARAYSCQKITATFSPVALLVAHNVSVLEQGNIGYETCRLMRFSFSSILVSPG